MEQSREYIIGTYVLERDRLASLERAKLEAAELFKSITVEIDAVKNRIIKIKRKMNDKDLYEAKKRSNTAG